MRVSEMVRMRREEKEHVARTVNAGIWVGPFYRVDKIITEGFDDVGTRPQQARRPPHFEEARRNRADSTPSGYEDDTAEHDVDPQYTTDRRATDPDLFGWVSNQLSGPVSSLGNNERELLSPRNGHVSKRMPFLQRIEGNTTEGPGTGLGRKPKTGDE